MCEANKPVFNKITDVLARSQKFKNTTARYEKNVSNAESPSYSSLEGLWR